MTWNSRLDVVEALEAAGWTADAERPLEILRHPGGATWAVWNDSGDCGLDTPGGGTVEFPGDVADHIVTAACMAAAAGAVVLPAGAIPEDKSPALCQQNRRGDARKPEPHFYKPGEDGVLRCVFCSAPAHWGGELAPAYRTPDNRVWTLAAESNKEGVALYEAPFVETRYTAFVLETMYIGQGGIERVDEPEAPPYVLNSMSVNQSPQTAVKHIPDGDGRTICPGQFRGTKPLPQEKAAEYALCNGCRKALLARYEAAEHADA
ncbi:hypothetical protein [Streptomyces afghaniensis]|uniref:hypothetical protein n=1 Tax=Streptomyces afghaniensis TaxID=66865 RepID=UPI0027865646|nr:hypothetical protein [Streptomyces afghaniensis]MDQ1018818.1 hypothetical protein [Streptomyces afghaniensis]